MADYCACGCGLKIDPKPFHKYTKPKYIKNHFIPPKPGLSPLSILDKTMDLRKGQTGFLAPKTVAGIRNDAKKAGYEWALDDLFVFELIKKDCSYCGAPSLWPRGRNGIDRINSEIGYLKSNCVSCCKICNRAKSNQTAEQFIAWGKRFYQMCIKNGER